MKTEKTLDELIVLIAYRIENQITDPLPKQMNGIDTKELLHKLCLEGYIVNVAVYPNDLYTLTDQGRRLISEGGFTARKCEKYRRLAIDIVTILTLFVSLVMLWHTLSSR